MFTIENCYPESFWLVVLNISFILLVFGAVTNEASAMYSTAPHVLSLDLTGATQTPDVNSCMLNPRCRE